MRRANWSSWWRAGAAILLAEEVLPPPHSTFPAPPAPMPVAEPELFAAAYPRPVVRGSRPRVRHGHSRATPSAQRMLVEYTMSRGRSVRPRHRSAEEANAPSATRERDDYSPFHFRTPFAPPAPGR